MGLNVKGLADRVAVSPDTVRYYEKAGLLPKPSRSANGYRIYGPADVGRIEFIKAGQAVGLKLTDIKQLLEIRDHGDCPCGHTKKILDERIEETRAEIERLATLKRNLERMKRTSKDGRYQWCCPEKEVG